MKTTVLCATLLCLELVSSFPFPESLPSYYGSYEPVGVPEQRVIPQPIQIPNLAHSQNSAYQQRQLAYLQQENLRRQNYEKLLRSQEQQQLKQRIANRLLIPPQPLNTLREPYISSIPLQRPIQRQYKAPITQQHYQNQQFTEPYKTLEPPQQIQVQNPKPPPVAEPASPAQNYQYNQQYQPGPRYKAQNVLYNQRIQQALAKTPLKKRYLVLHPNGTVEHIDKIERIVQKYPNYILVKAGDLPKPNQAVTWRAVQPVAPLDPGVVANEKSEPVAPVAPLTPVVPPTPGVQSLVSTSRSPPNALPPTILNATVPGPKPTVPPPTGPTTTSKSVTAPIALPPQPLSTTLAPLDPETTTPLPPTSTANPTVTPPDVSTSTTPSVTTENPTTPSEVTTTATVANPPPSDAVSTTPTPTTNTDPTVTPPSVVTATDTPPTTSTTEETTENPVTPAPVANANTDPTVTPPSVVTATDTPSTTSTTEETTENPVTPAPVANANTDPTVTPPSVVTATDTPPTTSTTEETTENPVTPAPVANTAIEADSQSPEATTSTKVPSVENQSDANATITESPELTRPDVPFGNIPTKPIVWFRSTDINFFDKLTSGNETFDIIYFFNIPREPRVLKDTKTTIHANGTVVEELTETIYDDEDAPPRVVKTTKVKNPDDSQPKT